jgi:hypothetical protein
MVFSLGRRSKIGRYWTLRAALNSIRPVLVASEPLTVAWKANG